MPKNKRIGPVFYLSASVILLIVIFGALNPSMLESSTAHAQDFISQAFGWYYLIIVFIFVIICLFFIIGPYGKIKLGKDTDKPEFNYATWFALLFSAGMGTGLVFWGAAEPLSHYLIDAPTTTEGSDAAVLDSMSHVYFHWGLHAWGIYAIVAICLAYFKFRLDAPADKRYTFTIDEHSGTTGKFIDIVAIIATVCGVATTLGFGATQINGGLTFMTGIGESFLFQVLIIIVITALFLLSSYTGIHKALNYLSNTNMLLAAFLLIFVIITGPTLFNLNILTQSFGQYLQTIPEMSFRAAPDNSDLRAWTEDWTIFYWAWWIAWALYVGTFIARVSRGRTLREFTIGVLLVPSVLSFIWFAFLGGTTIHAEQTLNLGLDELATEEMLFGMLTSLPFPTIMSILALLLIAVFFITSADSASFVLGMHSTNGSTNPPTRIKLTWGLLLSAIATILLYSGGLQALENTMIVAAFPFSIVMILMVLSLFKALKNEKRKRTSS
ncbi:LOW QUALITY PROTEIN: glycine betaine transporter OpuD [Geomicrobium sp. JCM 19037]|nr:LOW QUALITY PROTEIN: glycine betaine transporter OpuD [Geomicrobium sp. JCM 19037]